MICDECIFAYPRCGGDLKEVESIPDKNGFIIIALKCIDFKEKNNDNRPD